MENIEAMLCAYVEGDLDAAGKAQIEAHLKDNPQHRKLLEELISMRELVQGLPRAEAPIDLEDSLRQKVERSMLLEDAVVAAPAAERVDRWPQFFTVAAIFLLFASLCFILYRTLGPTFKPAVFTQNVAVNVPPADTAGGSESTDGQVEIAAPEPSSQTLHRAELQSPPPAGLARADKNTTTAPSDGLVPYAQAGVQQAQTIVAQSQLQVMSLLHVDMQSVRRRLETNGYGVANASAAPGNSPVLMVVASTDPHATNAQITEFLSNSAGISWKAVPAEVSFAAAPATMSSLANAAPQYNAANNASAGATNRAAPSLLNSLNYAAPAATQPSDIYVARGLTTEQAYALRQALIGPQNGQSVQVDVRSAQPLATTEPSEIAIKNDSKEWLRDLTGNATTQPAANTAMDLAGNATTLPSELGTPGSTAAGSPSALAPSGEGKAMSESNGISASQNKAPVLLPVDAVIVLQPSTGATAASSTTQPSEDANQTPAGQSPTPGIDQSPADLPAASPPQSAASQHLLTPTPVPATQP